MGLFIFIFLKVRHLTYDIKPPCFIFSNITSVLCTNFIRTSERGNYMQYVMSIIGILVVLGLCFALSNNKSKINFRAIAIMIGFQILIGWFMFGTKIGQQIIIFIGKVFNKLIKLGTTGVDFLFNGIQRDFVFFLNVLLIIVFSQHYFLSLVT